jgi:hypothetical protein
MRINGKEPRVIFALNLATELDDVRAIRAAGIEHFTVGLGSYKGKQERSYNVSIDELEKVRRLASDHNQESVLLLDNQYNAWLSYRDYNFPSYTIGSKPGQCEYIGEFREINENQAAASQSWSKFHGVYYAAR